MTRNPKTSKEMDLYLVAHNYLDTVLSKTDQDDDGIRVLLLDNSTSSIISMVSTQSELLKREIYLIDRLENVERDKLRNLKCICFLKPTDLTVTNLSSEINTPKYLSYEVYFNNIISKSRLERLAESDDLEMIAKVAEVFQDYYVLNKSLFTSVGISNPLGTNKIDFWDPESLDKSVGTVLSMLLSLNMKPTIRFESNSKMASKLAASVNYEINTNNQLFDQLKPERDNTPLLLILDRKNDPVTPLLFPWTYQSMIHELLGIHNNTVDLSHLANVGEELRTVVMNETQDQFYKDSMYLNFGDLSISLKKYVERYKAKTKTNSNIASIKDMKFFLENYPEYKKTSLNLSKHMLLSSEIDKQINSLRVWEISELEQNMCSSSDHSNHNHDLGELETLLFDKPASSGQAVHPLMVETKLKLLSLYSIKYETYTQNQTSRLIKQLERTSSWSESYTRFISILLRYSGASERLPAEDGLIFDRVGGANNHMTSLLNSLSNQHEDNAFMQHIPRLHSILDKISKCKLSTRFSTVKGTENPVKDDKIPPREVVLFMVGGVTYEEARLVEQFNRENETIRVAVGGTNMLNSNAFIEQLGDAGSSWGV